MSSPRQVQILPETGQCTYTDIRVSIIQAKYPTTRLNESHGPAYNCVWCHYCSSRSAAFIQHLRQNTGIHHHHRSVTIRLREQRVDRTGQKSSDSQKMLELITVIIAKMITFDLFEWWAHSRYLTRSWSPSTYVELRDITQTGDGWEEPIEANQHVAL